MREYNFWHWLISLAALTVANYFWTLHDWYFWDAETVLYIMKYYLDWHLVKLIWIGFFIISVYLVPFKIHFIIGWLAFRWASWEAWCYFASMQQPYDPGFIFGLSLGLSLIICCLSAVIPIIIKGILARTKKWPT